MMEPSSGEHLTQAIGPQVRSRVTVVCAECKRLKLKCDRRAPCGSCTKRDTVARCIYSPAAAEKVDLHSLNNRLIAVESQLAQISAPGARFPSSSSSTALQIPLHTVNSYHPYEPISSTMDDITAIWMEEIDIPQTLAVHASSSATTDAQEGYIKPEPSCHSSLLLPTSNPASSLPLPLLLPQISCYYTPHPSSSSLPLFTKSLLSHLPFAPRRRTRLYEHAEEALRMMPGPCFSWRVWKERAEGIWRWVETESTSCSTNDSLDEPSRPSTSSTTATASSRTPSESSKADTARTIFFGPPPAPPPAPSQGALAQMSGRVIAPSLPFFASVAGAFALALLIEESAATASATLHSASPSHTAAPAEPIGAERTAHSDRTCTSLGPRKSKKDSSPKENLTTPVLLHALSRQALGVWEGGVAPCNLASTSNSAPASEYDLDYISAIVLGVLFVVLCDKERHGNGIGSSKEGWILGEIGKLVNIARTMGLDVDPDLTPGRYGLYESEARRRAWWDVWWWDVYTSTLSSRAPLVPLHAFSTRLPLDVDEEVFTFACTSAPLLSPTGKEGVGRWFGMRVRLAQLVKDINSRTSLLSSLEHPSVMLSLEHASQCEAEIKQWLLDLPPSFRMGSEGESEESCMTPHHPGALSSNASHGSAPPTLLAQRLDILITTHRLAMGLYLPSLRPHSSLSSQSDSQSNVRHETSPQTHQARVGALTAAHGLLRAGRQFAELASARPDLVRRKDGLGLSLCCGLVCDVHSGFGRGVETGYSKALFDACVVCATSALRDPAAIWARTAVEDAKMGLGLLRDLRELCPSLDVSVVEALVRKLESGGSGAGLGSKRKREGWDEGDGRDGVTVPGGSGAGGNGEENVPLVPIPVPVPVPVISAQEVKLRSPPRIDPVPNAVPTVSSTNDAGKEKSGPEPRRTYPALVIPSDPSKFPPRKDRVKDRERGDKDKDKERSRDKDKDRKKASYPPVGFRVRHAKESSPLVRGRTESVGAPPTTTTTTTTQGRGLTPSVVMSGQPMPMSGQPMPMSGQPMPGQPMPACNQQMPTSNQQMPSSQPMCASQMSAMSQPPPMVPLQPPSHASTPIDRSYHSTPTPMSQEGGIDFSLPFGAAYEPQSQQSQPAQKFPYYDYASSSASPFSYPDTPQYPQYSVPPSTPTSFVPASQLPHYSGPVTQSQPSFPAQTQAPQYPSSQASYNEHPVPSQQQQQQQSRFSFGPQYPETGLAGEYYGTQEKQPLQRQGYPQEYPGEQQGMYGIKPSIDQHIAPQQGYAVEQQGYMEQTWTRGNDGAYRTSYPVQSQPRYQE
ncbi:hypothetical protein DFH29DRAFT_329972 [Suillus ampliporus]|nr:hypothetical protein DFH29DRAFT_329972 [Suillus ampliporus]